MYNIHFLNILSCAHFDYNDKKTSTLVVKPALLTRVDIIIFFQIVIPWLHHVLRVYNDVKYAGKGRPWTNRNGSHTQTSSEEGQ